MENLKIGTQVEYTVANDVSYSKIFFFEQFHLESEGILANKTPNK